MFCPAVRTHAIGNAVCATGLSTEPQASQDVCSDLTWTGIAGATAKLLSLSEAERAAGVVAVSGGNHGIALAHMAAALTR